LRCASQTHCCEATQSKGAIFEIHVYLQVIKKVKSLSPVIWEVPPPVPA